MSFFVVARASETKVETVARTSSEDMQRASTVSGDSAALLKARANAQFWRRIPTSNRFGHLEDLGTLKFAAKDQLAPPKVVPIPSWPRS